MKRGRRNSVVAGGGLALVVLVVLGAALLGDGRSSGGGDRDRDEATPERHWDDLASEAFEPLASSARAVPDLARRWAAGDLDDEAYRRRLQEALADAVETRDRIVALPASDPPPAARLYAASAMLHVEHVRVLEAAVGVAPGPLRDQMVLLARRLRHLGDRVFDRGHLLIDPAAFEGRDDVELRLPEEVPDWEAEGLAAGPPLAALPGPAASTPPLRDDERPTQPEAAWVADVERVDAPSGPELAAAIEGGEADRLSSIARRLVAAVEELRAAPDPVDGRERSARVRLGLLVHADAARAAQAAAAGGPTELSAVARRLALVGEDLWDDRLPSRDTGLDPALLRR